MSTIRLAPLGWDPPWAVSWSYKLFLAALGMLFVISAGDQTPLPHLPSLPPKIEA